MSWGFSLSDAAVKELIKMGWTETEYDEKGYAKDKEADFVINTRCGRERYFFNKWDDSSPELRTNKDLVAVVEKLGDAANSSVSELKIIEIPDDGVIWEIEEYDGWEWVREVSRTWC